MKYDSLSLTIVRVYEALDLHHRFPCLQHGFVREARGPTQAFTIGETLSPRLGACHVRLSQAGLWNVTCARVATPGSLVPGCGTADGNAKLNLPGTHPTPLSFLAAAGINSNAKHNPREQNLRTDLQTPPIPPSKMLHQCCSSTHATPRKEPKTIHQSRSPPVSADRSPRETWAGLTAPTTATATATQPRSPPRCRP